MDTMHVFGSNKWYQRDRTKMHCKKNFFTMIDFVALFTGIERVIICVCRGYFGRSLDFTDTWPSSHHHTNPHPHPC